MADLLRSAGCPVCRYFWAQGGRPPQLGVSHALHASLFRCTACGTYWEEFDRYAIPVTAARALADFPDLPHARHH